MANNTSAIMRFPEYNNKKKISNGVVFLKGSHLINYVIMSKITSGELYK